MKKFKWHIITITQRQKMHNDPRHLNRRSWSIVNFIITGDFYCNLISMKNCLTEFHASMYLVAGTRNEGKSDKNFPISIVSASFRSMLFWYLKCRCKPIQNLYENWSIDFTIQPSWIVIEVPHTDNSNLRYVVFPKELEVHFLQIKIHEYITTRCDNAELNLCRKNLFMPIHPMKSHKISHRLITFL